MPIVCDDSYIFQWLVTLLVLSAWLVVEANAQDESENEIVDDGEGVIRPISDEKRRERLRSFFTRRREESLKSSKSSEDDDTREEPSGASTQRTRSRFIRPRVTSPKPATTEDDEDDLEGFSTEKVSVSISKSVSTSVARRVSPIRIFNRRKEENKPEEEEASVEAEEAPEKEKPRFTQRKRFRLTKTSARNRGSLVEKVLANIDKQNEVEPTGDRRIRFRPSIRRENIRKKVQEAVGSDEVATERPKPRFRPSGRVRKV